jgi:hypothetical protein
VTPIDSPDVSRSEKEEAVALYEKLRRTALGEDGESSVHTYTLFISRGMAAWMKAWTEFVDATSNHPQARGSSCNLIPRALAPEVVLVLASMAIEGEKVGVPA